MDKSRNDATEASPASTRHNRKLKHLKNAQLASQVEFSAQTKAGGSSVARSQVVQNLLSPNSKNKESNPLIGKLH
jgi:hypothetical protein